jgi:hypothetical protein
MAASRDNRRGEFLMKKFLADLIAATFIAATRIPDGPASARAYRQPQPALRIAMHGEPSL